MARRPTRTDPSRTGLIRRRFISDINKRFAAIRKAVWRLVAVDDAFGLRNKGGLLYLQARPTTNAPDYRFLTDPQKVIAFRQWLQQQTDAGVLQTTGQGRPWLATYVESAYKKGQLRGYRQVYRDLVDTPAGVQMTDDGRLLGVSFQGPAAMARVEGIYTRAWNDMRGIADTMGAQLSRALSLGFAQGQNPLDIARVMVRQIDGLTRQRARTIARTEVIAAHAEGQLDAYEALEIREVTIEAEWLTAGDNQVCPECDSAGTGTYTLDEARGLIPLHPNCRCCWVPKTTRTKPVKPTRRPAPRTTAGPAVPRLGPRRAPRTTAAKKLPEGIEKFLARVLQRGEVPAL
jgi:SPP1 gp7 family putative phage head morphogenesis protein